MKIAIDYRLPHDWYTRLEGHDIVIFNDAESLDAIRDAEVMFTSFYQKVTRELIDTLPTLKLIAQYGVGYDNIDVEYCHQRGILVTNTPTPVIEPTAELCMALMMALARRISEFDRNLRYDDFQWGLMRNLGHGLYGKTLGIIGLGNIGHAVARRALANGMRVIYHNRHRAANDEGMTYVTMEQLLREADVVSLNLPFTPAVRHLIGEKELKMMKPSAYLINTARGGHIDEACLAKALSEKWIAGAALDVYEHEPEVTPELKKLDNCIIVPHVGTATWECRREMATAQEDNVLNFIQGQIDRMTTV
ncbi:MAG: NAD(P)-binding domain-containing protein [Paludibacteraceae bacterium]|nr:NAD(P)-binding domain-containing protein [Paludibacteraceae bacterium]